MAGETDYITPNQDDRTGYDYQNIPAIDDYRSINNGADALTEPATFPEAALTAGVTIVQMLSVISPIALGIFAIIMGFNNNL